MITKILLTTNILTNTLIIESEVFYQVPLQIILLLLAISETPTTGGLEAFFKQSSFFGIQNLDTSNRTTTNIIQDWFMFPN